MISDWSRNGWTPQVGEWVRIRDWDDMANEFGINDVGNIPCEESFVQDMEKYCGLEFEITKTFYHQVDGHGIGYTVSFDMIEPVENDKETELEDGQLMEFLSNFY